jgi:hypothetical protein
MLVERSEEHVFFLFKENAGHGTRGKSTKSSLRKGFLLGGLKGNLIFFPVRTTCITEGQRYPLRLLLTEIERHLASSPTRVLRAPLSDFCHVTV